MNVEIKKIEWWYNIQEDGNLYSKITNKILKCRPNNVGYLRFYFPQYGCYEYVHRLVIYKYIGEPPSAEHEVDHIDNNKLNNHYTNLRWVTHRENCIKRSKN
jgi:hypothetical protein